MTTCLSEFSSLSKAKLCHEYSYNQFISTSCLDKVTHFEDCDCWERTVLLNNWFKLKTRTNQVFVFYWLLWHIESVEVFILIFPLLFLETKNKQIHVMQSIRVKDILTNVNLSQLYCNVQSIISWPEVIFEGNKWIHVTCYSRLNVSSVL